MTGAAEQPQLDELLYAAAADALETMFFCMIVERSSEPLPAGPPDGERVGVRLAFRGDRQGALSLSVPVAAATEIAANFAGTDPAEEPAAAVPQALGELANIICGGTLSRFDPEGSFEIDPPQTFDAMAPAEPAPGAITETLLLESGDLRVTLAISPGTALPGTAGTALPGTV